jgi:hypothetical protein
MPVLLGFIRRSKNETWNREYSRLVNDVFVTFQTGYHGALFETTSAYTLVGPLFVTLIS